MEEKINNHRDLSKANNVNKAVQVIIFTSIGNSGIDRIMNNLSGHTILSIAELREILTSIKSCLDVSIELFTECQTSTSKRVAQKYA